VYVGHQILQFKKHIHSWCSNAVSEHFSLLLGHTFCVSVLGFHIYDPQVALPRFADDTFNMPLCLILVSCVFSLTCLKCLHVDVDVNVDRHVAVNCQQNAVVQRYSNCALWMSRGSCSTSHL
jgi:hypothetical protein